MFTTRPELVGTHGMVASTHWLASSAGMAVLESGGNAFDAAVAAGLTLQVVEPHLNGPGGEVPIIFHSAERVQTLVIGGQGPAPAAASIAHFEDLGLELVPGTGLLAACVPGAFDAWMVLLGEFGTLRLSEVMRYAIDYAGHGYPLVPRISDTIGRVEKLFRDEWTSFGTPGGDQQDQWSLNFFLSHVHFGLNLQEAIDAPNFHTEHFPSSFYPRTAQPGKIVVEDRLEPDVIAGLRARGHDLDVVDGWSLGRLSAVSRNTMDGSLRGAANPRGMQGYAVGR